MVMGQEERKINAKLEKTKIQVSSTSNDYEAAVKALEETTGRWNRDWKIACDASLLPSSLNEHRLTEHRNSKTSRKSELTFSRTIYGPLPISHQQFALVMTQ
jgi:hypothetical protein